MPAALSIAPVIVATLLCAWGAKRDLGLPIWLTLVTFAAATGAIVISVGPNFAPLAALALTCALIIETDRRLQIIPDAFTLSIAALAVATPFPDDNATRLLGALVLGATFLAVRQMCTARRGAEALGWGDVKLAAAMGAALGPVYGFAAVAIAGVATLATLGARMRDGAIAVGAPFGIGLAAATIAVSLIRVLAP